MAVYGRGHDIPAREAPRPAGPPREDRSQRQRPRRRERERKRSGPSFDGRLDGTMRDAGTFGCVGWSDMVDARFGGNAFAAAKGVERMQRQGLVEVIEARGPKGGAFRVLGLTAKGVERLGKGPGGQRYWTSSKPRQAAHDAAVYRAAMAAVGDIRKKGGEVGRIVIDTEFRSKVARRVERARAKSGDAAAREAARAIADELHLPCKDGKVSYPDARIEYTDSRGDAGRVDIEVATGHYRRGTVAGKSAAGFTVYTTSSLAAAARAASRGGGGGAGGGDDGGGGRGSPDDDRGLISL